MSGPILVVGSANMDVVVRVPRQAAPGETVLGGDYAVYPGGKGANQAVAAARAGGVVRMAGLVGDDAFGAQLRAHLAGDGVDTTCLGTWRGPSGIALITVDDRGQNTIVVSPGANGHVTPDLIPAGELQRAALVVLQLEIPSPTVVFVAEACRAAGVPVLLNPAPAQPLPDEVWRGVRYLVLNETESEQLGGVAALRARGADTVILTLGARGVCWSGPAGDGRLAAQPVPVVDTTAAGDAFCGALAAQLAGRVALPDAIRFANAAGALAVTRHGAQPSLGRRAEIEALLIQGKDEQ